MSNEFPRLAVSEIRAVMADPKLFRKQMISNASQPRSFSKMQCLRLSCFHYHKQSGDIDKARDYLEKMFLKNFKNINDLEHHIELLEVYVRDFEKIGNKVVNCRDRMTLELPADLVVLLKVTGETSRIDLTVDGFAVWMIGRGFDNWKTDPRFPILQGHYARALSADPQEVSVGVFDFDIGFHESKIYRKNDVLKVTSEFEESLRIGFS